MATRPEKQQAVTSAARIVPFIMRRDDGHGKRPRSVAYGSGMRMIAAFLSSLFSIETSNDFPAIA
jgi:hypothetical protein